MKRKDSKEEKNGGGAGGWGLEAVLTPAPPRSGPWARSSCQGCKGQSPELGGRA